MQRWSTNLAIVAIDSLLVRAMAWLSVPLVAVAAAAYASERGIGLLNWLGLPGWAEVLIAIVVLDFAVWAQHVASHKVAVFWRLHQMHHADRDIDVTTALRFIRSRSRSRVVEITIVLGLRASAVSVIAFEVIQRVRHVFPCQHPLSGPAGSNRRPRAGDARYAPRTPFDLHHEHNSNYGFNLSVWDGCSGRTRQRRKKVM